MYLCAFIFAIYSVKGKGSKFQISSWPQILTTIPQGRRVKDHDKNVHNLCVQNVMGRVGGEANLVNDNKCRVFFFWDYP